MSGLYARLGVSCAIITANQQFIFTSTPMSTSSSSSSPLPCNAKPAQLCSCSRKEAYKADIVYGTASAFGFDYLREHLVNRHQDLLRAVGLKKTVALLDEADNILLDEARTPLIISRPARLDVSFYHDAVALVRRLIPYQDYEIDQLKQRASFTEEGITKLEKGLKLTTATQKEGSLYSDNGSETLFYLENCLKALVLYNQGEDYLVRATPSTELEGLHPSKAANSEVTYPRRVEDRLAKMTGSKEGQRRDGEIILIDRVTGRPLLGRRFGNGLHEALEAKEGLKVRPPATTVATISLHAYFRQYGRLAGLSGTLETDRAVLHSLYGLTTVVIPPHRPRQRLDAPALVFGTHKQALQSLIGAAIKVRQSGGPVLIGTPSVGVSEEVSHYLKEQGIPHQLLNAQTDRRPKRG